MTWKNLTLFVNTLSTDDKYCLVSRNNLMQAIQMDLSQKQKTISNFFLHFSNLHQFLKLLKKDDPYSLCISEINYSEISG